jgi:hypothetical protein
MSFDFGFCFQKFFPNVLAISVDTFLIVMMFDMPISVGVCCLSFCIFRKP